MTDTYEKIAASAPVSAQAAKQMGKGVSFSPAKKLGNVFRTCPELRDRKDAAFVDPNFRNLTGMVVGRLTVVGLSKKASKYGARWVARCSCGNFMLSSTSALKNRKHDRCGECDYTRSLRNEVLFGMKNHKGAK